MTAARPQPLRLAATPYPLSAVRFGPPVSEHPVLLALPPLCEERKGAVPLLAELARRRADAGRTTLLFDYTGTGDSPGAFEELSWHRLRADGEAALAAASALCHTGCVILLGLRLGARFAAELAAQHPAEVSLLVCWEPVLDGGAWLKEIRRRSRFRGTAGDDVADIDGYLFHRELQQALLHMDGEAPALPCPCHILSLVPRSEPTAAMRETAAKLEATLTVVKQPPFWLEGEPVRHAALLEATLALV